MREGARRNLGRLLLVIVLGGALVWALAGTEFEAARLARGLAGAADVMRSMFPPDWSVLLPSRGNAESLEMPKAWKALIVTVQMALVGTFLGFVAALPVSFLAARTMVLPRAFSIAVKTGLNILRAVPGFVYAVLFVSMVGLGPFPGALGIGLGSFVMLAKLFAESLESVHPAPIEAVKAAGGNSLQVFVYGMLPQAMPQFLSHTLYAWELNISAATIVGIVGAGGIGFELITEIHYFNWHRVCAYVLVLVAMVLLADGLSYQVRKRFI